SCGANWSRKGTKPNGISRAIMSWCFTSRGCDRDKHFAAQSSFSVAIITRSRELAGVRGGKATAGASASPCPVGFRPPSGKRGGVHPRQGRRDEGGGPGAGQEIRFEGLAAI